MDLNGAKYPSEALFYSDIRCYEQGAGQKISPETNQLPAMACYPLQKTWFWKTEFPGSPLKDVDKIVAENIIPYNNAYCTYILNSAPNRDGLMDQNCIDALKRIGKIWKNTGHIVDVAETMEPITDINIAIGKPCDSSWSDDMDIMDFANDDDFRTCWVSSPEVKEPFWKVELDPGSLIDMVVMTEPKPGVMQEYVIEYLHKGSWHPVFNGTTPTQSRVKVHRFDKVYADAVRVRFTKWTGLLSLSEFGVYTPYGQ